MNKTSKEIVFDCLCAGENLKGALDNLKGSYAVKYVLEYLLERTGELNRTDVRDVLKQLRIDDNFESGRFNNVAKERLQQVDGVEAAFLTKSNLAHKKIMVVAQEHGIINRSNLMDLENELEQQFDCTVDITVWARQKQDLEIFVEGMPNRLF